MCVVFSVIIGNSRIQTKTKKFSILPTILILRPCPMCNDKQGMGAPPKPKQPAVRQDLDLKFNQLHISTGVNVCCSWQLASNAMQCNGSNVTDVKFHCRRQLASNASVAKPARPPFLSHPSSPSRCCSCIIINSSLGMYQERHHQGCIRKDIPISISMAFGLLCWGAQ